MKFVKRIVIVMFMTLLFTRINLVFAQGDKEPARPSVNGALHVEGSYLQDEKGNVIQLKGISTHGIAWFPEYVNEACFQEISNWKANVIRLAMYTDEYHGYCTDGNKEELKNIIEQGITYATTNDMYVIIDWHVLCDQDPNKYKEDAKMFFGEMAEKYADHTNVLYEICNEPNGDTTWQMIKDYAMEILPVIREKDKDAIVIVGTPNWCQFVEQAAADPIMEYDNILYSLHFYAATHKDDLRNSMINALHKGLPIIVSEYGICDASGNGAIDLEQANQWIQIMDQNQVSYIAWNLSNKAETSAIISNNCSKTSGFTFDDLSESGKWLYQILSNEKTNEN